MNLKNGLKNTWLSLSMVCFVCLLGFVYIEIEVLYPQIQRYFEATGKVTDQPLASRARGYLLECLDIFYASSDQDADLNQVQLKLDMAYGLLNVNLYKEQYPCTATAFTQMDNLLKLLDRNYPNRPDSQFFTRAMLPILQCTDTIETGQDRKRAALATDTAQNLDFHRRLLFWGVVTILLTALGFWGLHMKQRRMIAAGRDEANKWINHAMRDGLTGVFNRRAFDIDLANHLNAFTGSRQLFSVLMCDIDSFKLYNDSFGHVEGDKALQHITTALTGILREQDRLYRYGGEELAVILEHADNPQAHHIGQRALEEVGSLQLLHPETDYGYVTISIGCATVNEIEDGQGIVELADKRLYRAKQTGRNRIVSQGGE